MPWGFGPFVLRSRRASTWCGASFCTRAKVVRWTLTFWRYHGVGWWLSAELGLWPVFVGALPSRRESVFNSRGIGRRSEPNVFCRNREANIPDSIDYTSLLGHYSVTTISYSVGARIGAHLSCPPIVCLKQGREVASALLAAHLAVTTGRRDRGRTPPVATCGNRGSEVTRRK